VSLSKKRKQLLYLCFVNENRVILHIDMDAFYASIEQRDNPDLRGKPVVVGGSSQRGVVAAASYEARKYGIHSAMPSVIAKRRCSNLIFIRARFDVYREVSEKIQDIFLKHTHVVEPLSLDEAYLDISEVVASIPAGEQVARKIRQDIYNVTKLRASAGISFNKFLAKMASDINKPDGQYALTVAQAEPFLQELPVQMFHGIGTATTAKMNRMGIFYGKDLRQWAEGELVRHFGKAGHHYFNIVRGNDLRKVNPDRIRKSVGVERTFGENLKTAGEVEEALQKIITMLQARISRHGRSGKTLTLKLRYADFTTITHSKTSYHLFDNTGINQVAHTLLREAWNKQSSIRLLGLTISNLDETNFARQLKLNL